MIITVFHQFCKGSNDSVLENLSKDEWINISVNTFMRYCDALSEIGDTGVFTNTSIWTKQTT